MKDQSLNILRCARARYLLAQYAVQNDGAKLPNFSLRQAMIDVITDLRHLAEQQDIDLNEILEDSSRYYLKEVA